MRLLLLPTLFLFFLLPSVLAAPYNLTITTSTGNPVTTQTDGNMIYCQEFTVTSTPVYLRNASYIIQAETCDGTENWNWSIVENKTGGGPDWNKRLTETSAECNVATGDYQVFFNQTSPLNMSGVKYYLCDHINGSNGLSVNKQAVNTDPYPNGTLWRSSDNGSTFSNAGITGYDFTYTLTFLQTTGNAPIIAQSLINTSPYYVSNDLLGYCEATDADNATTQYNYTWYKNGVVHEVNSTGYVSLGSPHNVDNISSADLTIGENWILECQAFDGSQYSAALNSSTATITFNASVYGQILDEQTDQLITDNCTITTFLNNTVFAINETSTGNYNISGLSSPGNYTIRHTCDNYVLRDQYTDFTLSSASSVNVTLYLLTTSAASFLPITVTDLQGERLQDIVVHWKRWFSNSSAYEVVEMTTTVENGESNLNFEANDAFYQATILEDGVVKKTVTARRYTSTDATNGVIFAIDVSEDPFESYIPALDIMINNNVTYDGATRSFSYIYTDTNNIVEEICLNVYEKIIRSRTLVNSTCSTSSSATLVASHNPTNNTIVAEVILETNTENSEYVLAIVAKEFLANSLNIFGGAGVFITGLLVSSLALITGAHPAISILFGVLGLIGGTVALQLTITKTTLMMIAIVGMGLIGLIAWRERR